MYLFTKLPKRSLKQSYNFLKRLYSEKCLSTKNEKNDSLMEKFEKILIYNTVIEANRLHFGYHTNQQILMARAKKEEELQKALQTIQPLPLTLKLFTEHEKSDKLSSQGNTRATTEEPSQNAIPTTFPYTLNNTTFQKTEDYKINSTAEPVKDIKSEIINKKKFLDESSENWMTHYENYENDLECGEENAMSHGDINYGTPDKKCPASSVPCGGCGAYLHCQDISIPGYIPSELFKNSRKPGGATLSSILCQRCHFLQQYNIALQTRVTPEDYLSVIQSIPFETSLIILMVDLSDFPCSIWPGLADIFGMKSSLVVVGNKVDLIPKDDKKYLHRIKSSLVRNLKINGFGSANIKHVELISAKTGYGVESLITALNKVWSKKGDVYLVGCTNVGKSSLFNQLIRSDFCKSQAENFLLRATTSPWPGTTLNLLKFPITRFSGFRLYMRHQRIMELAKLEKEERKLKDDELRLSNKGADATLVGRVERSFTHKDLTKENDDMAMDLFANYGSADLLGKSKLGINPNMPDYVHGKWCYDTPGVLHPDQILHLLTLDELRLTLPEEIIRPETFRIKPGMTMFIAGLARLDYVSGAKVIRLTVFRSNKLPITVCETQQADYIYEELLGSELFTVPIFNDDIERQQKWPGLELSKNFKITGKDIEESSYDVVLSNAGWIAINCDLSEYEFNAWTPEKRGVHIRESLLPKAVKLRGAPIRASVAYKRHKFI
ncbi:nitric oxide-associated protein 1 [Anthonomus grandis grandis]|uniref:nitric oxide-associated protein 1 n=1 Tax=Anthonomus grandis grandis TaxID=2921223 RepID=UPI002166282B|nr:nitric oxide-associated protein 1 [Anthonomus grandis grandis]